MDDKTAVHNAAVKALTMNPMTAAEPRAIANAILDLHDWVGVFRKEFSKLNDRLDASSQKESEAASRVSSQVRVIAAAMDSLRSEVRSLATRLAVLEAAVGPVPPQRQDVS